MFQYFYVVDGWQIACSRTALRDSDSRIIQWVSKKPVELTVLICGTALGEPDGLGRFAGADKLPKFLAAEWGKRGDLIPAAHAIRWK